MKGLNRKFLGILTLLIISTVFNLPIAEESSETPLFPLFETSISLITTTPPASVHVPHLSFFNRSIFFSYWTIMSDICVGRCDYASLGSFKGIPWAWVAQMSPLENTVWVSESVFTEYNGYVFAAFKGVDPSTYNSDIYYAYFNPRTLQWSGPFHLTDDPDMDGSPAIGVYNGKLYVAWESNKLGTWDVWYRTFDIGTWSWSTPTTHPKARDSLKSEGEPEMVEYCGKQFWVWREDEELHLAYYDGGTWSDETTVGEGENPTIAAYANRVFIVWQQYMAGGRYDLYYRVLNATTGDWLTFPTRITSLSTDTHDEVEPSILILGSKMYIIYNSDDSAIYFSYADLPPYIEGYPYMFMDLTTLDVAYVVGDTAPHGPYNWGAWTVDVLGLAGISETIAKYTYGDTAYSASLLDTKIATYDPSMDRVYIDWGSWKTLISVGGPAVNIVTYKYDQQLPFHLTWINNVPYIHSDLSGTDYNLSDHDYFVIAVLRDGDRNVMIIWGLTGEGSRDSCLFLQRFYSEGIDLKQLGKAVIMHLESGHGWVIDEAWFGEAWIGE